MNFWRSLVGQLRLELTSAEPEKALRAINALGIGTENVEFLGELTCCVTVSRRDYKRLKALADKRGDSLNIHRHLGLYWMGRALAGRPVLLSGMGLVLALTLLLPTRILFIRVEGNKTVPQRAILAAAEEHGIGFGASREQVRSEKVKNAILSDIPQLQWAGVNTAGCVATISVRERAVEGTVETETAVTDIVAIRDGYILSATATQGDLLTFPGQTVSEGDVLISGIRDCGICIQAGRSEGEVLALTRREVEAVTPSESVVRGEVTAVRRRYSLKFGKKRINFWKGSSISQGRCGRMYKEYYVTLPGDFVLPVALCVEEVSDYQENVEQITPEEAEAALKQFSEGYLKQQMAAGTLRRREETLTKKEGRFLLMGSYVCTEMIGREQRVQIGDTNGKNNGTDR